MADIIVDTNPPSCIDYSIIDGRIRYAEIEGETLYDEEELIAVEGWKQKIVLFVIEHRLYRQRIDGFVPAFVSRLEEEGLIRVVPCRKLRAECVAVRYYKK